jgi:D-alanyl-D-alanine carboxypeptidase/D-alanyl-D-alanine-endopeptidase (penicillin-binding protein 4)
MYGNFVPLPDMDQCKGDRRVRTVGALWLLIVAGALHARNLESDIKRIIAKSPIGRSGYAGVLVVDAKGKTLVSINAGRLFTPASNTKLFSTALALEKLGPEKRFETRVELRGKDLVLVGTGDANLSGRVLPYVPDSLPGPPLTVIEELAAQVQAHGIQTVEGDVVGDDTAFLYEPYAPSWTIQDTVDGDGPAASALVVNDNVVHLRIHGATASLDPNLPVFPMDAQVTIGTVNKIESRRLDGDGTLQVRGTVKAGDDDYSEEWSVGDPALFGAMALKDALIRRGIAVHGAARALHREEGAPAPPGETVAQHISPPLLEDLRLTDKISQNLHADLLLSDVAGSRSAGLRELSDFLGQIGIKPDQYHFYDGSGLSRSTLVTPDAVVALLRYMSHSAHSEQWFTLLPIAGVDGSLEHRLDAKKTKGRIRAKTGTLGHVSALSGYAEAKHEKELTFSIFLNNTLASTEERRELIDKICTELVR